MSLRAFSSVLLAASLAGQDPAWNYNLGHLDPSELIAFEILADTNGDGRIELVLATATGELRRYGIREPGGGLELCGVLRLRDPQHSLVTCRDIDPAPGDEIVVADTGGTYLLPWPADGVASEPRALARGARFTIRVDIPQKSPFVQDLDRDGRLDLLIPSLQGCVPYLQERGASEDVGTPRFRALPQLPLPVQVTLDRSSGALHDDHEGGVSVPQVETADLNGDGRPDLLTREGDKRAFHLQLPAGGFAAPIELDLTQFQDSTPAAAIAPGATFVLGDRQQLQRGDIDGDGIPDFVIAHRRKVWTFVSSSAGPQFLRARTQAVADDVSGMLLVDLDEDKRSDLLTFQVQVPGIGALLLGLVQSIDIDVKAVGYRSEASAFTNTPQWRRTITLRVPPLLSLLSRQEEIVERFLGILNKARQGVRGAFSRPGSNDLALVAKDGTALELFPDAAAPTLGSRAGRRQLRDLLFENPDPLFDLERMFALLSGLLDKHAAALTADKPIAATIPLRDPAQWRIVSLFAANVDDSPRDEVVVVYESVGSPQLRAYEVVRSQDQ